jgi:fucose 4-O-acetylase-like acetyltransferase
MDDASRTYPSAVQNLSFDKAKTDVLRVVCIFLMTANHVDGEVVHVGLEGLLSSLIYDGFARVSSPLLGLMSGVLLAVSLDRLGHAGVLKRRGKTLLIPYLKWNLGLAAVYVAVKLLAGRPLGDSAHLFAVLGVNQMPTNMPLHYIRDLALCVLLFVGLHRVLPRSRPLYTGVTSMVVGVVMLLSVDEYNVHSPLPRVDLLLFFTVGFFAVLHRNVGQAIMEAARRHWTVLFVMAWLVFFGVELIGSGLSEDTHMLRRFTVRCSGALGVGLLVLRAPVFIEGLSSRLAFRLFCLHFPLFFVIEATPLAAAPYLLKLVTFPVIALGAAQVSLWLEDRARELWRRIGTAPVLVVREPAPLHAMPQRRSPLRSTSRTDFARSA